MSSSVHPHLSLAPCVAVACSHTFLHNSVIVIFSDVGHHLFANLARQLDQSAVKSEYWIVHLANLPQSCCFFVLFYLIILLRVFSLILQPVFRRQGGWSDWAESTRGKKLLVANTFFSVDGNFSTEEEDKPLPPTAQCSVCACVCVRCQGNDPPLLQVHICFTVIRVQQSCFCLYRNWAFWFEHVVTVVLYCLRNAVECRQKGKLCRFFLSLPLVY